MAECDRACWWVLRTLTGTQGSAVLPVPLWGPASLLWPLPPGPHLPPLALPTLAPPPSSGSSHPGSRLPHRAPPPSSGPATPGHAPPQAPPTSLARTHARYLRQHVCSICGFSLRVCGSPWTNAPFPWMCGVPRGGTGVTFLRVIAAFHRDCLPPRGAAGEEAPPHPSP